MFERQKTGSVVCSSCGKLVSVKDAACWNCGRRNPGLWGFAPLVRRLGRDLGFVQILIAGCVVLYLLELALFPAEIRNTGILSFLSPGVSGSFLLGASGAVPIFGYGRWWTVLSAGWLHGSLLHIGFNLYWVTRLAPLVAELYGPGRAAILYLVSSAVGFAMTSFVALLPMPFFLKGASITLGASAALFGWLGALIYYGRRSGSSSLTQWVMGFAVPLFVLGLLVPMIDNWAHIGGFVGGYGVARWLDPLKPERIDHLLWALILLALSALAILVSVLQGLPTT